MIKKRRQDPSESVSAAYAMLSQVTDFTRTNESIVRPWWFIFNFLVLDFKVPLTPHKGIGNPAKFLLVESGIPGFGVRNTAQGIGTPTNEKNPESKFH